MQYGSTLPSLIKSIPCVCLVVLCFSFTARSQQIAIVTPDKTETSLQLAAAIEDRLVTNMNVADSKLASDIFAAADLPNPYNQSVTETRKLGTAIGCRFLLLIRSDVQRRASLENTRYFESFAAIFLADARNGELISWSLKSKQSPEKLAATELLYGTVQEIVGEVSAEIAARLKTPVLPLDEFAADPAGNNRNVRFPMPYRRIKPEYTRNANLYGVEATLDIAVSVDAKGNVVETRILRWAGFGLEESVEKTIREMQWRPADRDGVPFPMTVMLRYNFKDIENL